MNLRTWPGTRRASSDRSARPPCVEPYLQARGTVDDVRNRREYFMTASCSKPLCPERGIALHGRAGISPRRPLFDHNPDHNPVRVQGGSAGFGMDTERENPAFCGALWGCRRRIRTFTN